MAFDTDKSLQKQVIYSIYVRNHTEEGTFAAIEPDLKRIRELGCDVIWFLPIHPIGEKGKKGSLGCPYANKDYRTVNPCYGTMEEFRHLVDCIHEEGMKVFIDVVYNHTSPDSTLAETHPEWFHHNAEGKPASKVADWTDVVDLDYANRELWDYQIESLKQWAGLVDGFRWDAVSLIPLDFIKEARKQVKEVNPSIVFLGETIHTGFGNYVRSQGGYAFRDVDGYEAFDLEYEYDIRETFEKYLEGKCSLSQYLDLVDFEEAVYPDNYNKLRFLENHDTKRFAEFVNSEAGTVNYSAMLYFEKGTTMLYGGQEYVNDHCPSLFEKEPIDRHTGKNISGLLARLAQVKKEVVDVDDHIHALADDEKDIAVLVRQNASAVKVGVFSLRGESGEVSVPLPDGPYKNAIDGQGILVFGGKLQCKGWPIIIRMEKV